MLCGQLVRQELGDIGASPWQVTSAPCVLPLIVILRKTYPRRLGSKRSILEASDHTKPQLRTVPPLFSLSSSSQKAILGSGYQQDRPQLLKGEAAADCGHGYSLEP